MWSRHAFSVLAATFRLSSWPGTQKIVSVKISVIKLFSVTEIKVFFSHYRPRQSASFDVERHEFLCPLCKSLSNAVLPILPNRSASSVRPNGSEAGQADMSIWLEGLQLLADNSREIKYSKTDNTNIYETCGPTELETKLGSMKSKLFVNVLMARTRPKIATTLKEMASLFVQSVYTVSSLLYRPDGLGV